MEPTSRQSYIRLVTPLVGRGKQLRQAQAQVTAWLETAYDPATFDIAAGAGCVDARNRLLVFTGVAAVGKSRLAYELVQRLAGKLGASTTTAHCTMTASLSTFAAEIARVAGLDSENLPERWDELCRVAEQAVSHSYAERARRHLPLLALALGCESVDTGGIRQADPSSFALAVRLALRACCELPAHLTGKPVVLVIEDLQWMGSLREVVGDLLHHACLPQPLIMIATARPEYTATPEELDALAGEGCHRLIGLPPLARTEGGRLMQQLLPGAQLPPSLELDLAGKADGLPYYYEEFARVLQARGLVTEKRGRFELTAAAASMELPADVQELIAGRISQLEPAMQRLVGRAAVIGQSFSGNGLQMLEQGLGGPRDQSADLASLDRERLVVSSPGDRYFFEHVLARNAAYATLSHVAKTELHEQLAGLLEEILVPGTASEWDVLPELIRHLEAAGRFSEAHVRCCQLLLLIAEFGQQESWREWESRAVMLWDRSRLTAAKTPDDSMHLLGAKARLCWREGETGLAREHYQRQLGLARQAEDALTESRVLKYMGELEFDEGRISESLASFEPALVLGRQLRDRRFEGEVTNAIAMSRSWQGDWRTAHRQHEEALAIALEVGNRAGESAALHCIGRMAYHEGDFDKSRECIERALVIARDLGNRRFEGWLCAHHGESFQAEGDLERARLQYTRAQRIFREIRGPGYEAIALRSLGELLIQTGDYAEAQKALRRAADIQCGVRDARNHGWCVASLGELAVMQGELHEAKRRLDEAEKLLRDADELPLLAYLRPIWIGYHLAVLAQPQASTEVATAAEHLTAARAALAESVGFAQAIGAGPESVLGRGITRARLGIDEMAQKWDGLGAEHAD